MPLEIGNPVVICRIWRTTCTWEKSVRNMEDAWLNMDFAYQR